MDENNSGLERSFATGLEQLFREIINDNNNLKVPGNAVLYHYTSFEGLKGIIGSEKKGGLWFTRYDCLNDKSEGLDFWKMYDRVLDDMMMKNTTALGLIGRIKGYRDDKYIFIKDRQLINDSGDFYICCFCENDDNLPMWNYYGKNGYCIGIDKISIESVFKSSNFNWDTNLTPRIHEICKVIYDDDQKYNIINKFVCGIVDLYCKADFDEERKWYIVKSVLSSFIGFFKLIFKNKHYEHENEIRVITIIPKRTNDDCKYNIIGEKKYREREGMIVPYFDCKGAYHIRSIKIAPKNISDYEKRRNEGILNDFLVSVGRDKIKVTSSNIPIRF